MKRKSLLYFQAQLMYQCIVDYFKFDCWLLTFTVLFFLCFLSHGASDDIVERSEEETSFTLTTVFNPF